MLFLLPWAAYSCIVVFHFRTYGLVFAISLCQLFRFSVIFDEVFPSLRPALQVHYLKGHSTAHVHLSCVEVCGSSFCFVCAVVLAVPGVEGLHFAVSQ